MTFLILTEKPSRAEQLTAALKAQDANSLCLEMASPAEAAAALREVLVDCVVLQQREVACDFLDGIQQLRLVHWPENLSATELAEQLFPRFSQADGA